MKKLLLILPIVSCLLLAAHFFRAGNILLAIIFFIIPIFLLLKKKLIVKILQAGLIFGIFIWFDTFLKLFHLYKKFNLSFQKAGILLSFVIILTFISIFVFNIKSISEIYKK